MAFTFEKLNVYQKAIDFADAVCKLTKGFPGGYLILADQLSRAAFSITGDIAEGNGLLRKIPGGRENSSGSRCWRPLHLRTRRGRRVGFALAERGRAL